VQCADPVAHLIHEPDPWHRGDSCIYIQYY
jgi:hypothetical protein